LYAVIASEAKQSMDVAEKNGLLRRFAPRNDEELDCGFVSDNSCRLLYAVIASEAKQSMDVAEKEWIASSLRSSQ
jgi:hypothetical protein